MTSFERPDAGLLVEYLLPSLLGASHSLSQEIQERTLFFGELGTALEALHGRFTVISSPPHREREESQYPWLWRYLGHFTVGWESRAVQHAKLWAFHWKVDDEEFLELYVSSTNLTASAFKAQIQAGWQVTLPLKPRRTVSAQKSWGELVTFLDALGTSAGAVAANRLQRLVTLLARVECPADVTFIASVPGGKSAGRQLKQFKASKIHVLTPTIGEWNARTLASWSCDVGVALDRVHLKWISTKHPWADPSKWALSNDAYHAMVDKGKKVKVECMPDDARFTKEHRAEDDRWSHAKLYLIRSRKKRRLLVTSANWSASAWGTGKTAPRNFELGVVFESAWIGLEAIDEPFDPPNTFPFCVDRVEDDENPSSLEWAEATWDGKRIDLRARSSDTSAPIDATIGFADGSDQQIAVTDGVATMPWSNAVHTPRAARFTQGGGSLEVDVLDLRPPSEFAKTPLPEVDPALAAALREAFLLQRYGGPIVDADAISGLGGGRRPDLGAPAANYSVQAWLDARAAFHVVDQWRAALADAQTDAILAERVRSDGEELRALYVRREGPAAGLAAEEFGWRLEALRKKSNE